MTDRFVKRLDPQRRDQLRRIRTYFALIMKERKTHDEK